MNIDVLNLKGEKIEQLQINDSVFNIEPNKTVISQYVRVYLNNQRQGTSSTKDRSEVSGGGKKPFKQKGTGRARSGSTRNPLWRHGGVSHGPTPKSWNLNLSKQLKRLATVSALSDKFINKNATVVDKFDFVQPKTKEMVQIINDLNLKNPLIVTFNSEENIVKSASNIKGVKVTRHDLLNTYDILNHKNIVFTKQALLSIEEKFSKSNKEVEK